MRCGEEHSSKTCPLINNNVSNNGRIPENLLKCANCGGNHSAKNMQCPKRGEYIKVVGVISVVSLFYQKQGQIYLFLFLYILNLRTNAISYII